MLEYTGGDSCEWWVGEGVLEYTGAESAGRVRRGVLEYTLYTGADSSCNKTQPCRYI